METITGSRSNLLFATVALAIRLRYAALPEGAGSFRLPTIVVQKRRRPGILGALFVVTPLAALSDVGPVPAKGLTIAPRLRVPTNMLLVMDAPRRQLALPVLGDSVATKPKVHFQQPGM